MGLEYFEKEELFTRNNISLKSLANDMGPNSSYLSKYINAVKAENFSTYLNDLRIQFVLHKLYKSKTLRSFTIQAIATDIGISTAKSFSSHFKRVIGPSVSYFLKKIEVQGDLHIEQNENSVIDFIDRINKAG